MTFEGSDADGIDFPPEDDPMMPDSSAEFSAWYQNQVLQTMIDPKVEVLASARGYAIGSNGHHSSRRSHGSSCDACVAEAEVMLSFLRGAGYEIRPFAPDHPDHPDKQARRNMVAVNDQAGGEIVDDGPTMEDVERDDPVTFATYDPDIGAH